MNHIPSSSDTLPLLFKHSLGLSPYGFNVSISPVFWRGGLYPWNLNKLQTILQNAQNNGTLSDTNCKNINSAIDKINASNKTMLVFKKNHPSLKSSVYSIFSESKPSDALFDLYNAVESIFQSHPVKYPYLALPKSPDAFVNSLSPSKRYYYQRYRKQFLWPPNFPGSTSEYVSPPPNAGFFGKTRGKRTLRAFFAAVGAPRASRGPEGACGLSL